jgi:N-carbamoyl-L-amino-acid hydrolase
VGGDPDALAQAVRSDIRAFFELHIEQGPVLEAGGVHIGVVSSIVGIRRIEIAFEGQAAHAGTAPMDLRRDAGFAGAAAAVKVREHAETLSRCGQGYFVATVGILQVEPGGSNVVPGRCRLVIDVRSEDTALTDRFTSLINLESLAIARTARVERSSFVILSDGLPALMDGDLRQLIAGAADRLGYSQVEIASGAGHDAAFTARICPSAMVFIPCLRGMSHTPDEWSEQGQVAAGAAVTLEAMRRLDAQPAAPRQPQARAPA